MPKSKTSASTETATETATATAAGDDVPSTETLQRKADSLFRSAMECCRQRRRYACLVEASAAAAEQRRARTMVTLCDEHLREAALEWEMCAARATNHRSDDWWHRTNSLWHAAREYARRHQASADDSRRMGAHDSAKLARLALEFDLEASALLAIHHAVDAYRKVRPQADLSGCRTPA
jgi:hypothetical protein